MTDIIDAAQRGDTATVSTLLDANPKAFSRGDAQGMTPLMWAAVQGHAPVVELLLARGADASVKDPRGTTALLLAAERGHLDVVRLLLPSAGADERGEALRRAVGAGRTELTVWLLDEVGVALEYGGTDGKTPLTCATISGHAALAEELLRRGAQVEARSTTFLPLEEREDAGWHPLHYAADRRHPLLVQLLLDAGAQVDAQTSEGTTPLMLAAARGDEDNVRLLLKAGANPLHASAHHVTALSLARLSGRKSLVQLLEAPLPRGPMN